MEASDGLAKTQIPNREIFIIYLFILILKSFGEIFVSELGSAPFAKVLFTNFICLCLNDLFEKWRDRKFSFTGSLPNAHSNQGADSLKSQALNLGYIFHVGGRDLKISAITHCLLGCA